jgi:DNA replication protein DnaC
MKTRAPEPNARPLTETDLLPKILEGLSLLLLPDMRQALEHELVNPRPDQSRIEWLWALLEPQVRRRVERRVERRIREARLPARKTLEAFDFAFQADLDKDLFLELATLRFLDKGVNVLFAGMSGTGKTHLAMALALAACVANRRVLYTTSANMLARLHASLADASLSKAIARYVRAELLVVDEVGLEQVESRSAARSGLMQKVLFPRYDQSRSTIITSNIPWEAWGDYLDDHLGAAAILDRLIHRSHVIVINGPSYREHSHQQQVEDRSRQPGVGH